MMAMVLGRLRFTAALFAFFLLACTALHGQGAGRFDLTGPKVEVHVTRGGKTLPIASVPNLQPGDKIWLHADLPPTQSVHYLLVAVFLRGTTNPPPDHWFTRIQTWEKKVREEGFTITVPDEAQQAILFLAPETGGDFSTLRSAVRARPGVFVRASQDLTEAGFEQARIEKYVASMRQVPPSDPKALQDHSNLLARTLNLKPNQDCFSRPIDMQYNCLTQSGNQTLLDDGHGQTIASNLTSGANADFINAASYTGMAGAGMYSAYVGAVVDLVRVMSGLHTAHYQYIPAIAFPEGESLNLRLNTPPSFDNPKSVIVIGLPAVHASTPPPLRPADPKLVNCLLKPSLVLPVEGAPLVFSTAFTHDLILHINGAPAENDIPLSIDAFQGGLILAHPTKRKELPLTAGSSGSSPAPAPPTPAPVSPPETAVPRTSTVTGTISGFWGFDAFTGPTLQLQDTPGKDWKLDADDVLIAGRENRLTLTSTGTACVQSITLDTVTGKQAETQWKQGDKPNLINVTVPLQKFDPGALHLAVRQFGEPKPDTVAAQTFSEPARLVSLKLHAGDTAATLTGTSLDQVQQFTINGLVFTPAASDSATGPAPEGPNSTLRFALPPNAEAPKLRPDDKLTATFTLKDGRNLTLPVTVAAPRPSLTILNKSIGQAGNSPIHLAAQDDLPVNQQLTFSLRSSASFPRTGQIEVSSPDDSLRTLLSVSSGTLVLQNPHTLLATLDPLKAFGTSAYGPLRIRAITPEGIASDWLPLVTLVRLPDLKDLHCPPDAASPCTLTGLNLYLIDSIASNADFTDSTPVPEGFVGSTLSLPRPPKTGFYLKLRDDPTAANTVTMPILPLQASTEHRNAQP